MKKAVMAKTLIIILLLAIAAAWLPTVIVWATSDTTPAEPSVVEQSDYSGDGFVPGEVLAPADSREHAQAIAAAYNLKLKSYAYGVAVLAAPNPEMSVAHSKLVHRGGIPKLGLNRVYSTSEMNNMDEPTPSVQWRRAEMDVDRAWELSTGENVMVAIIDTGIDINHPAFAGRLSAKSYNSQTEEIGLEYVQDDHPLSHGTHVSGIAVASIDEAVGVFGVAPDAEILVIKSNMTEDPDSLETASWIRGLNYAVENGAQVVNMSFGRSYFGGSDDLEWEAIANAVASGVTVVCAAGNWGESHANYPAAYPESMAVSATKPGYRFENEYSNYGPEIDVAAPGSGIYSTVSGGGYELMDGTSMASPNVTGIAALVLSLHPEYTPRQVRDLLSGTARDAGELGQDDYFGYGVINAYAAALGIGALCDIVYDLNNVGGASFTVKHIPGNTLIKPYDPRRDGYAFDGWYVSGTDEEFDFDRPVEENLRLYARWVEIKAGMYIIEFPDVNFRREVLRTLNEQDGGRRTESYFAADDVDLLASITWLNASGMDIHSLTGLSYLTGLEELWCRGNSLTQLDVTMNTLLESLDCSWNELTELDVSQNTRLRDLDCSGNALVALDISKNTALSSLSCGGNQLTALDVSKNTALEDLRCGENQLTALDVSHNTELVWLNVYYNQLTRLDVSKNTALESFICWYNKITELDLSKNIVLRELDCDENWLETLDVSKNTELESLWCQGNRLTTLDVSNNASLGLLGCAYNYMESIDKVIGWHIISELILDETFFFRPQCAGSPPTGTDITASFKDAGFLAAVRDIIDKPIGPILDYDVAQIRSLSVDSWNTRRDIFDLSGIEHFHALSYLDCSGQQLNELDVSKNTALIELACHDNQLYALELSNNTELEFLNCSENQITSLDISKNTKLLGLYCWDNQLAALDVSQNTSLMSLSCMENYMKSPDSVIGWETIELKLATDMEGDGNFYFYPQKIVIITAHPAALTTVTQGAISDSLRVTAGTTLDQELEYEYQWFSGQSASNRNGAPIDGATSAVFTIPAALTPGTYYYYCVVSVMDVGSATSHVAIVQVNNPQPPSGNTTPPTSANPITPPVWVNPYSDVTSADWFFEAVRFATESSLMTGTGADKFSPHTAMTRAMLVTVLYRLEGKQAVSGDIPFLDVKKGEWYSDAILWASQNDIVYGYNNATFGLNDPVTREQTVTILYRYADLRNLDVSASANLSSFTDRESISDWALDAMQWAVAEGIIQGRTATTVVPQGTSTRAEVATIFMRF